MSLAAAPVDRRAETPWRRLLAEFAGSRLAVLGLALFVIILSLALLAPLVAPQDPYDLAKLDLLDSRLPPGSHAADGMLYALGTDDQGRDLFSAILYGLRTSLWVGAGSAVVALAIGAAVGMVAAYAGGRLDAFLMRIVDIQLSFPAILVALILLALLGRGVGKILLALVTVQWAYYARTVRGTALVERQREYVEAARCLALPTHRIVFRHLLPNCLPPLIVVVTVQVAHAIALEATLSFLGIGLPVTQPSLGLLVANGYQYMLSGDYWISFFPGFALLLLIVSINLAGDRLRDVLNPRLRR
ncbi:MAG TPA: ABC transporter permease [Stellaceae bacterium]|nr:ABC transporter permease [Stellaceae bacterium]